MTSGSSRNADAVQDAKLGYARNLALADQTTLAQMHELDGSLNGENVALHCAS